MTHPTTDTQVDSPSYGFWEVLAYGMADTLVHAVEVRNIIEHRIFKGFIDEIAFALTGYFREGTVLYFRKTSEAVANEMGFGVVEPVSNPEDEEYLSAAVDVLVDDSGTLLSFDPNYEDDYLKCHDSRALREFFADRDVFATYNSWCSSIVLHHGQSVEGAHRIKQRQKLEAVLAKLTADDIKVLQKNGFQYEK